MVMQDRSRMRQLPQLALLGALAAGVLAMGHLGNAQTGDGAKGGDKELAPKKIPLDKFKMPPGGVLVLVEEGKDVRNFFPRMVVLTPEKYQELTDKIATLEKLVKGDRKTPFACKMTATVEGETVRVVATLHGQ